MAAVDATKYLVGDFVIDTARYQLSQGGQPVPVEPKVFDLLVYLIRNRNRVLTREELFEQVWEGRPVSDATLSNHVMSARKALGDEAARAIDLAFRLAKMNSSVGIATGRTRVDRTRPTGETPSQWRC